MTLSRPVAALLLIAINMGAAEVPAPVTVPTPAPPAIAPAPAIPTAIAPAADIQPVLDLPGAIALALRRNEQPEIAATRIERAMAAVARARAALLPQLTVGATLSTAAVNEFPAGGEANETASWSAGAQLTLFNPGAWSGLAAAKYGLAAQQFDSLQLRRALAFSVVDVYLTIIASERQVGAAERRLGVSQSSVSDAKARLQAGLSTRTDVTRAELQEAQAQLSITQARRAVTASRLALADLIVSDLNGSLAIPEAVPVPDRDGATLRTLAISFRPDLKALKFREAAADQTVRAAYGRYVPTVGVRADASHASYTSPAMAATDDKTQVSVALVASWSLWDGGDREGAIDQARADRGEASLTLTSQLRGLNRDILTALADLETAEASLAQAQARDRLARANADEVRARYKQGLATALEDADAISSQFEAESGLVSSRLDLDRARLALRRLTGLWPLTDREPEGRP